MKRILLIFLLILPLKVLALIEVDITRGNLNPFQLLYLHCQLMKIQEKVFKILLKKKILEKKFLKL